MLFQKIHKTALQCLLLITLALHIAVWMLFPKIFSTEDQLPRQQFDEEKHAEMKAKLAPLHEQSVIMVRHFLAGAGGYIALSYNVFGYIIEHPLSEHVTFPIYEVFEEVDNHQPWLRVYLLRSTADTKSCKWQHHVHGLELRKQYFIGLKLLHFIITLQRTKLLALFRDEENDEYLRYAIYDDFVLGNQTEEFRIKRLGKFGGNTENWLHAYLGKNYVAFNVSDMEEQQRYVDRCPMLAMHGWWGGANIFCKLPLSYRGTLELYIRPYDKDFKMMEI